MAACASFHTLRSEEQAQVGDVAPLAMGEGGGRTPRRKPLGLGKEWRDGHVLLYTGACRVVSATDELSNEGPGGLRGGVPVL